MITVPISATGGVLLTGNANDIHLVFNDSAKPYSEVSVGVYQTMTRFYFQGSDKLGEIKRFTCVANSTIAGNSYDIRLFDITNSLEIAVISVSSPSNTTAEIQYTVSISNVPTEEAILEIQGRAAGPGKLQVSAGHIEFENS
jgi:hypothetical protein